MTLCRLLFAAIVPLALCTCIPPVKPNMLDGDALWHDVVVRRTEHGVPHILARDFASAGYAIGYVQCEDYGRQVVNSLLRARGERGKYYGRDSLRGDFTGRQARRRAVEVYGDVDEDTRDVYDGFAAGV